MLRRVMMAGIDSGGGGWGPEWGKVAALLHFDGPALVDEVGTAWVMMGSAAIANDWAKFGDGSLYVPAATQSGISASLPSGVDLSGDYTVSFWVRPSDTNSLRPFFYIVDASGSVRLAMYLSAGGEYQVTASGDNNSRPSGPAGSFTAGVPSHVAIVRKSGGVRVYINGALSSGPWSQVGSQYNLTAMIVYIGRNNSNNWRLNGYIDEFLIYGGALYDGPFTPPAAAYPSGP